MVRLLYEFFEQLLGLSRRRAERSAAEETSRESASERRRHERVKVSQGALIEWLDDDNRDHARPCRVIDRSSDGMELGLPEALPSGWPVLVTPADGTPIKAIVRHARETDEGPRAGVLLIHDERRRFDRRPCDWRVRVRWEVGSDGGAAEDEVCVLDTAEGGIRLRLRNAIPEATVVCISHDGWHRFGAVAHCSPADGGFEAGVQFIGPPHPDEALEYHD